MRNICPRCQGKLFRNYEELECVNCGYSPEIILSDAEKSRMVIELAYMSNAEYKRWLTHEERSVGSFSENEPDRGEPS